jgi:GT2 family glycosyltransferase
MKKDQMKVSIVILNWNGKKMLERFLSSVYQYSTGEGIETVVADNNSTDDSLAFLTDKHPGIRQIILDKNYGFAEGYNQALKQLDSRYYILLNSDVEVTENWIDPLISYMDKHPDVVACQPKIRSYLKKDHFEHAGACGGFIDYLGYPFCRGRILDIVEKDEGQYDSVTEIFWASGAAFVVRSQEFWNAGGFDGRFFAHMEEIDLCWKLKNQGKKIVCIPQSTVFHVGGGTLNVDNPHKTFLNFRNNLLMIYKNEPEEKVRRVLFIRFFLDYAAAGIFLLKGNRENFRAVLGGRKEFRKMKPLYKEFRKKNSKKDKEVIPEIYPRSIIIDFYLKRIKKFHEWRN